MERPNLEEEKLIEKIRATWKKQANMAGPFTNLPYSFYASPCGEYAVVISENENIIVSLLVRKVRKTATKLQEILKILKDI